MIVLTITRLFFARYIFKHSVPSKPFDLKTVSVTRKTISVTWQTPQYPNGIIKRYLVSVWNDVIFKNTKGRIYPKK